MDPVGPNTDKGGSLPRTIWGYREVWDLVHPVGGINQEVLSQEEVKSYRDRNFTGFRSSTSVRELEIDAGNL